MTKYLIQICVDSFLLGSLCRPIFHQKRSPEVDNVVVNFFKNKKIIFTSKLFASQLLYNLSNDAPLKLPQVFNFYCLTFY